MTIRSKAAVDMLMVLFENDPELGPMMHDEDRPSIEDMLHIDALRVAEEIKGISYKEDEPTQMLGFGLHIALGQAKERKLMELGDTTFRNDIDRYVGIITDYGFELVLEIPFEEYEGEPQMYYIYWHPDGLLLAFDTYGHVEGERTVNGANVYYNLRPHSQDEDHSFWEATSGGSMEFKDRHDLSEAGIWVGHHDAREALIFKLDRLRAVGDFLPVWEYQPFLWLLHYGDSKEDYRAINVQRIAMLPEHVRDAIGPYDTSD